MICCDCGKETVRRASSQKRCIDCQEVAYKIAHRRDRKTNQRWKMKSGVHCSKCYKPTGKPGLCEPCKAYVASWKIANRDKVALITARRRSKEGALSPDLPKRLLLLQRGKCVYCKTDIRNDYHMDHITPLALGGTNADDNIQMLCATCNLSKGSKHPVEFAQRRGLLL